VIGALLVLARWGLDVATWTADYVKILASEVLS